ncbi:hypothetical protein [Tumebacillus permanentifrigoris]|uniref:Uncharacterized protein n=1 Tax=Tumebacillus permanentifrigoris TaxID=378543 RepID=A0A316D6Y1_9BACL|nr:hypothetical protein [Tumebacillus permanentifrigoris]PWK10207.1 hypothetical protein C7459_11228 [Tumebacillus permanentifrigoris]
MIGRIVRTYLSVVELELIVAAYHKDTPDKIWCIDESGALYIFYKEPDEEKFKKLTPTNRAIPKGDVDKIIAANHARCEARARMRRA